MANLPLQASDRVGLGVTRQELATTAPIRDRTRFKRNCPARHRPPGRETLQRLGTPLGECIASKAKQWEGVAASYQPCGSPVKLFGQYERNAAGTQDASNTWP